MNQTTAKTLTVLILISALLILLGWIGLWRGVSFSLGLVSLGLVGILLLPVIRLLIAAHYYTKNGELGYSLASILLVILLLVSFGLGSWLVS